MRFVRPTSQRVALRTSLRRFAFLGVSSAALLLSCGREPTAPQESGTRLSSALRFTTVFPQMLVSAAFAGATSFDKVHIVLHHTDGTIALDTTVVFPADSNQVSISLNVHLLPSAPPSGEPMTVDLGYLNPQGQVVYSGTATLTAMPDLGGASSAAPVSVNVAYTGPGAGTKTVRISPRQLTVNTGSPFAFTAQALDSAGNVVANTPIEWVSLDPTRANIAQSTDGVGNALNQRGTARIVATAITGQADTVVLGILPVATSIVAVSGSGQSGIVNGAQPFALPQPLVVSVIAADGLGVAGTSVTFGVGTGGGSVSPTSVQTDANGQAQANWTLGTTVGAQTVTASAASLSGSPVTFTATGLAQVAAQLAIIAGPTAGSSLGAATSFSVSVAAQDASGTVVPTFAGSVSISLSGGAPGSSIGGTTTVSAVNGVATFSGLSISAPGNNYVLQVAAAGLTPASTPAFNVVSGAAVSLALVAGGNQSAAANAVLAPITVFAADNAGNGKAGVVVGFVASGGGSASPASGVTDNTGKVSTTWTLGPNAGTQTLSVSSVNLPSLTVSATATSAVNHWVITQQPAAQQTAGVTVTPALVAQLFSPANVVVTSFSGTAQLAIATNPGGATLGGTASVTASAGVATFSNFSLDKAGAGYTVSVSSTGGAQATSSAFTVVPGAASALSLQSGNNQGGQASAQLAQPIVAKVTDAFGNVVAGSSVTFAVTSGGGSVGTATAQTNANGLASTTWTLGPSGTQTLAVASSGLTGSPITVSASFGAGPVASTVVAPHVDTLTSISDTYPLVATGRDASNNVVAGSFTWVSRSPSIATVSVAGVVTSVTNGSTYVVATEAGGTKDSALIVVQQRTASINVTPGNRSLYTGGHFTFTASAVDGRGFAMSSQPAFTWSSTQSAVATVNSATGVVQAITLGATQIQASSGSTVGVANLTVITPITRIDVSYDSTGAPAPDVFTMTSLGAQRVYRAVARDTLLNVVTGVTFAWTSSNSSVAPIDSFNTLHAFATAAANGVTNIQASAQGVTGAASLTVAQVLASIDLQPPTSTVAVTGTTLLVARGRDALNHFIPGGTFSFASSAPSIATVNAATGLVTGVANGSTNITASSGAITSNVAVVSVNSSGPAIISFGRDTIAIGRGGSQSVPILLSKPSASPVKINLTVGDTSAFWSAPSFVTIPAGQTSVNATLNGHNAGTTIITALDASGTGYAGDTAVLLVQANVKLATTSYSMNATDQLATQVVLSDPSPAGGTFVTFTYGTQGTVSVSPNPAFIPAGQLASNVVVTALSAGNTTITPSATGVNGTASSVFITAAVLSPASSTIRLGAGQYYPSFYVQVPNYLNAPLTVTLTSSDTNVTTAPPTVTIPAGTYFQYFNIAASGRGTATITMSAPGWTSAVTTVTSTTPRVTVCCGTNLNTTAGITTVTAYAADSLRSAHQRTNSLAVRVTSSDTTVIRIIDTLVTIAAGTYYNSGRVAPGVNPGTAWVKVSASGHAPDDSTLFTVIGPALSFGFTNSRLGTGQTDPNQYVQIPNAIGTPVVVTISNSDATKASTVQTVTISAGQTYQYFSIQGNAAGVSTFIATAQGYQPDTAATTVTSPKLVLTGGSSLSNFSTSSFNVYSADSTRAAHNRTTPLVVHLASTDTTVFTVDSVVTIPAGSYYAPSGVNIYAVGPGTARVVATAVGQQPDSVSWTVNAAKLSMNWTTYIIAARQHQPPTSFYVSTPSSRAVSVPVTLTQKHPSILSLSATSLAIPANSYYQYFTFGGLVPGRDTVIASAPGYLPDTGYVTVTSPSLRVAAIPTTATTTNPPYTVTLYTTDTTGSPHYASDTVVVRAVSSDTTVIKPGQPFFRIIKDTYFSNPTIIYVGAGSATITYSDSAATGYPSVTTNSVAVTGPSLGIAGGNPGMLGMRQQTSPSSYYVYSPNNVGQPLTVNLVSTDPRVATVPASVVIPANSYYAYFTIAAQDTIGTIQIQATAVGYAGGTTNMQVTAPKFIVSTSTTLNTTSPKNAITVYAADANGTAHYVTGNTTVTLASSAPGVAVIDSQTVTITTNQYYNNAATWSPVNPGSAQLSASDTRPAYYKYGTGTVNVTVVVPSASLSFTNLSLGIGQYTDQYAQVPDYQPNGLTVPLSHAAVPHSTTPASVAIPVNSYYQQFRLTGTSVGSDTITASPAGHNPGKGVVVVGLGRIDPLSGWPTTVQAGDSVLITLYARDPNQGGETVTAATTFSLSANGNIQFVSGGAGSAAITTVTIPANGQYVQFYLKGVSPGTGSATITATNYTTYSNSLTVTP